MKSFNFLLFYLFHVYLFMFCFVITITLNKNRDGYDAADESSIFKNVISGVKENLSKCYWLFSEINVHTRFRVIRTISILAPTVAQREFVV